MNRYAFTRAARDPDAEGDALKYMVRSDPYALLLYSNGRWRALYDLARDPEQRHNVLEERPGQADELIEAFSAFAAAQKEELMHFVDPTVDEPPPRVGRHEVHRSIIEERRRLNQELRALGYLK